MAHKTGWHPVGTLDALASESLDDLLPEWWMTSDRNGWMTWPGIRIHPGVVDGVALCRMFNSAIHAQTLPKYLSSDHDPLYRFHQWQANLRVLEVKEIKTVPYAPMSHPFVERLIGTIRREHLDQTLFWTAADLEQKLRAFQDYFNRHRVHSGLKGRLPEPDEANATLDFASYRWQPHCRGLYETPIAA